MTTINYSPANATEVLSFSWDTEAAFLPVNAMIPATFTLSAAQDTLGLTNFSFNIVVTGTEQV